MPEPTPLACGLRGLCPRCGTPGLFVGMVRFAPTCTGCGLDFQAFNVGDGPALFLILLLGTLAVVAAVVFEFSAHPPWWAHALIWPPVITGLTLLGLRAGKGLMLGLEYKHKAGQGRIG